MLAMACRKSRRSNLCDYYKNVGGEIEPLGMEFKIQDLEELAIMGSEQIVCPFFLSRNRLVSVD